MVCKGLCVSKPVDMLPEGKFRVLRNVRSFLSGRIEPRPGLVQINGAALAAPVHSYRRLNDPNPNAVQDFTRVVGAGTNLLAGRTNPVATTPPVTNLSGNPFTSVPLRPDQSPEPWLYVADYDSAQPGGTRTMFKVRTDGTVFQWGIAAPVGQPTPSAVGGSLIGTYAWRFRFRSSLTGAKSNPSSASGFQTLASQAVTLNPPASPDPQVDTIDWFRFGGTVNAWRLVLSIPVSQTGTDNLADNLALAGEVLEFDNFQPFPSEDITRQGGCNTTGNLVTWTVGPQNFNPRWPDGTAIVINGKVYQILGQPTTTLMLITPSAGNQAGAAWIVSGATLLAQNVPYVWGPYGLGSQGAVIFGCGDPNRPGFLLWTKGNNADSAPSQNSLEVTSPSEPLQNGCIYDGTPYVWSTDRLFRIYPSINQPGQFTVQEVPNSKGLLSPWAFAIGPALWAIGKDGIYETKGGEPVSITDEDLYPIFPHEGQAAFASGSGIGAVNTSAGPGTLRLCYYDKMLYFDYPEIGTGKTVTLVFDTINRTWWQDLYYNGAGKTVHFPEEGKDTHSVIIANSGVTNSLFYHSGVDDAGTPIQCTVGTGYLDQGDSRSNKLYGDQLMRVNAAGSVTGFTVTIDGDAGLTAIVPATPIAASTSGLQSVVLDVNAGLGLLAKNIGLLVTWQSTTALPAIFEWMPSYVGKPPDTLKLATDWTDDGTPGAKFLRGVIIEADTGGVARTAQIQYEAAAVGATITVNHSGQLEMPYGFAPFVGHEFRVVPTDANSWRLFKVTYIWDAYPEFSTIIPEDFSDLGKPGTKYVRGLILPADSANVAVNVQVQVDGGTVQATLAATHNGRTEIPYAFVPPFACHNLRLFQLGNIRIFKESVRWIFDEYPELSLMYTPWVNGGTDAPKHIRGVRLKADTLNSPVSINVQTDGGGVAVNIPAATHNGQQEIVYAFATPFAAYLLRLVPGSPARIFEAVWIYDEYPDKATLLTAWSDGGINRIKYVRGGRLKIDTGNVAVNVAIQADGGGVIYTIPNVQTNGQQEFPFAVPVPFVAYLMRFLPAAAARIFGCDWDADPYPDLTAEITAWLDAGTEKAKYVRGARVRIDTANAPVDVQIQIDGGFSGATLVGLIGNGQQIVPRAIAFPFIAYLMRLAPAGPARIFGVEWDFDVYPDLTAEITAWTDDGNPGAKWLQGMRLLADTNGAPVTLTIQGDGGVTIATVVATHSDQIDIPYSWTPGITHQMRIVPSGPIRIFKAVWVWEPLPELASNWITEGVSHGPGYFHERDGYIALMSTAVATLTIAVDGVQYPYSIPSTGGLYQKPYVVFQAVKGKLYSYSLTSAQPLRLFKKDCEFRGKSWGTGGPYQILHPFGDIHSTDGATI